MLTVHIYRFGADEHLGAWYPEGDQVQVPRKGDTLYLETDEIGFDAFDVIEVQWAFRSKTIGNTKHRSISAEVHVRQRKPLWRRFVELFPSYA